MINLYGYCTICCRPDSFCACDDAPDERPLPKKEPPPLSVEDRRRINEWLESEREQVAKRFVP